MYRKEETHRTIQIDCFNTLYFSAVTEAASCVQNLHKSINKSLLVAKDSTVAEVLHRELNEEKNYLPEKFDRLANPIREIEILRTGAERTLCLELRYAGK